MAILIWLKNYENIFILKKKENPKLQLWDEFFYSQILKTINIIIYLRETFNAKNTSI